MLIKKARRAFVRRLNMHHSSVYCDINFWQHTTTPRSLLSPLRGYAAGWRLRCGGGSWRMKGEATSVASGRGLRWCGRGEHYRDQQLSSSIPPSIDLSCCRFPQIRFLNVAADPYSSPTANGPSAREQRVVPAASRRSRRARRPDEVKKWFSGQR